MINKDRLIRLTRDVVAINSENPPGREKALADYLIKNFKQLGLSVKTYTYSQHRPNVVATLKGQKPRRQAQANALLLTPHIDTVPIGNGWRYDPLGGEIVQGRLYGRGTTDDKGNLAVCLEVLHSLIEDEFRLKNDVILAATVDEETGSQYGIIPLLKKKILHPKLAVVMDSTEYDAVVAQKGLIHGRIQILGRKAHGAYLWRGVNAIEQAAEVINALKKLKWPYKKHPLLKGPSLNIGTIRGGDKVNMVSDFCEFSFDFRYLDGMKSKEILNRFRTCIRQTTKRFRIQIDDMQAPYDINPKHPDIALFMRVNKHLKSPATFKGSEGATVMTFFKDQGIPAFATGYGAHQQAHTNDEYVRVSSLYQGARIMEAFVKEYDCQ